MYLGVIVRILGVFITSIFVKFRSVLKEIERNILDIINIKIRRNNLKDL
jgi:hypothetical protein